MEHADIIIIGAGVVGLAIAAEVVHRFPNYQVIMLERNDSFGQETSSRNSEVIHSGIYYPENSLKARLCVEGNKLLYEFCLKHDVPCAKMGKLILAIKEEDLPSLLTLREKAAANGVAGVRMLEPDALKRLEPNISAQGALLSPSTGIVDTHSLMKRLERLAEQGGLLLGYRHQVKSIMPRVDGYRVLFNNPNGSSDSIDCSWLINCAGLHADRIASWLGIDVDKEGYRIYPCKGEYFSVAFSKGRLVNQLLYPPPLENLKSLGIHVTKGLDGRVKLGPSAFYVDKLDYSVDAGHTQDFYHAVKRFLPFLASSDLTPDMAGIRPKLQGPGDPFRDFIICHESSRGLKGIINLIGIESPGLTCCLSIARLVGDMLT